MTRPLLDALFERYMQHLESGNWQEALAVTEQALAIAPDHPQVKGELGLCLMRLGRYAESATWYHKALQGAPFDFNLYDGMAELCGLTGKLEEARQYGLRALTLKDNGYREPVVWPLPQGRHGPPPISLRRECNVIAFGLYGEQSRYCDGAVRNVERARELFPQWQCRFYVDSSVPSPVLRRLEAEGAQLVHATGEQWQGIPPELWHFAVMEDASVSRFLLRDTHVLPSVREQAAVQDWLQSGQWFHMMRDHFTHTELLRAGQFGGCGGVFGGIAYSMRAFAAHAMPAFATLQPNESCLWRQQFLRHRMWPTVRQSLLTHDSVFGFMSARPFPAH